MASLIANHVTKENGITYLDNKGLEMLRSTLLNKLQQEVSPVDNLVATLHKSVEEKQLVISKV